LAHLDDIFGKGKVNFFALDNEPGIWHETHRDVHPKPLTYDELWNRTVQYALAIKKYYPNAKIFGPVPWGWCEYMFSSADSCTVGDDRKAHGDLPLLEWYIQQIGQYRAQTGIQLVDVIDVHIYPQGNNIAFGNEEDVVTAALRFRSLKGLYDPSYIDESWIGQPIYLIPRIRSWINQRAPGLQIGITEYNWGGDNIISAALAQVILLGIFARENVYVGTRWVAPESNTRTEEAFLLFTNYDGKGSSVQGDVVDVSVDSDQVEAFAFVGKNAQIVFVNKREVPVPVILDVSSFTQTGTISFYAFSASEPIGFFGNFTISGGSYGVTIAGWAAILAVISP